jgi:hypothetical protein
MATKPVLPTLTNTGNVQTQLTAINNAFRLIEDEFEAVLGLNASDAPNSMGQALDMNSAKVINVSPGTSSPDAATFGQLEDGLDTKADLHHTHTMDDIMGIYNSSPGAPIIAVAVDNLNSTDNLYFWSGSQAQYDALGSWPTNRVYIII